MNADTYPYTEQLKRLFSKKREPQKPLPSELCDIVSPINITFWQENLQCHPDNNYVQLLVQGLEEGFHIGVDGETWLKSSRDNLISVTDHPDIVSTYIKEEYS